MQNTREAFWRKKGYKILSVFLIRFVETIVVSIIPSVISVFLILVSQDPNSRAWKIFQFTSFIIFYMMSCFFWLRFMLRRRKLREFIIINGVVYIVYSIISVICFTYFKDVMLCSLVFAPLRGFEGLGFKTMKSLKMAHLLMVCTMFVCGIISYVYVKLKERALKKLAEKAKENEGAFEENPNEKVAPMQNNKKIQLLSLEEIVENAQVEKDEFEKAVTEAAENMPDAITKGDGAIIYAMPENFEEDFDEDDVLPNDMNENEQYSSDALWDKSIYKGRNIENKVVIDYDKAQEHDEEIAEVHEKIDTAVGDYDADNLWDNITQGNNKATKGKWLDAVLESDVNPYEEYDADSLWGNIHQGRTKTEDE